MAGPSDSDRPRAIVVTGAASGIGRAIVQRLTGDGHRVAAVDLRFPDDVEPTGLQVVADLSTLEGNELAVQTALDEFGELDAIVANAGFQHIAPIAEFDPEIWDRMLAVLLTSPFLLARFGWPSLAASGRGRFVAIASAHGLVASPFKAAYVAAKHGLLGLVKTIALEGAGSRVTATAICPGYVRTPLVEKQISDQARAHGISEHRVLDEVILAPQPIKRLIEPDEVARYVSLALSDLGEMLTGAPLVLDGGWTAR